MNVNTAPSTPSRILQQFPYRSENKNCTIISYQFIKTVTWLIEHVKREPRLNFKVCLSHFHSHFICFFALSFSFSSSSRLLAALSVELLRSDRQNYLHSFRPFLSAQLHSVWFLVYITCIMNVIKNMMIIKVDCEQMLYINLLSALHSIRHNKLERTNEGKRTFLFYFFHDCNCN